MHSSDKMHIFIFINVGYLQTFVEKFHLFNTKLILILSVKKKHYPRILNIIYRVRLRWLWIMVRKNFIMFTRRLFVNIYKETLYVAKKRFHTIGGWNVYTPEGPRTV